MSDPHNKPMQKIGNRDEARAAIAAAGITYRNVTTQQLSCLKKCINNRMKVSDCYKGTYRMNAKVGPYMTCRTDQWESREAVSFNGDGFIGFAGWADARNIVPILDGVTDWLVELSDTEVTGE